MLNDTKIRVSYPLSEILRVAYVELANQNLVPYTVKTNPIGYHPAFNLVNAEGEKITTDLSKVMVNFGLEANSPKEEEEAGYKAGSWKDEEVDKIIDEHEKVDS